MKLGSGAWQWAGGQFAGSASFAAHTGWAADRAAGLAVGLRGATLRRFEDAGAPDADGGTGHISTDKVRTPSARLQRSDRLIEHPLDDAARHTDTRACESEPPAEATCMRLARVRR